MHSTEKDFLQEAAFRKRLHEELEEILKNATWLQYFEAMNDIASFMLYASEEGIDAPRSVHRFIVIKDFFLKMAEVQMGIGDVESLVGR